MKNYICKSCNHNSGNWCEKLKLKINSLSQMEWCKDFQSDTYKKFRIERTSKDYYGQQFIEISINNESISFPEVILKEFIEEEKIKSKEFEVNYEE